MAATGQEGREGAGKTNSERVPEIMRCTVVRGEKRCENRVYLVVAGHRFCIRHLENYVHGPALVRDRVSR